MEPATKGKFGLMLRTAIFSHCMKPRFEHLGEGEAITDSFPLGVYITFSKGYPSTQ